MPGVPEGPEEVGWLAGKSLPRVQHMEEEGEFTGEAGLPGAEVAQNYDPQLFYNHSNIIQSMESRSYLYRNLPVVGTGTYIFN